MKDVVYICIPGMACAPSVFDDVRAALTDTEKANTIVVDIRPMVDVDVMAKAIYTEAEAFRVKQGAARIVYLGHSTGGYVAQVVAGLHVDNETTHTLQKVVLLATSGGDHFKARYSGTHAATITHDSDTLKKLDAKKSLRLAEEVSLRYKEWQFRRAVRNDLGQNQVARLRYEEAVGMMMNGNTSDAYLMLRQKSALVKAAKKGLPDLTVLGERVVWVAPVNDPFIPGDVSSKLARQYGHAHFYVNVKGHMLPTHAPRVVTFFMRDAATPKEEVASNTPPKADRKKVHTLRMV